MATSRAAITTQESRGVDLIWRIEAESASSSPLHNPQFKRLTAVNHFGFVDPHVDSRGQFNPLRIHDATATF